jgi:hypothetical protein
MRNACENSGYLIAGSDPLHDRVGIIFDATHVIKRWTVVSILSASSAIGYFAFVVHAVAALTGVEPKPFAFSGLLSFAAHIETLLHRRLRC